MGAFGKMLIEHWGGGMKTYEGHTSKINKTEIEESKEELQKRKIEFEKQQILSYARAHLDRLTTNIIYKNEIADKISEKLFIESYNEIGYSIEVSSVMWIEYCDFINKYIKK